MIKIAHLVDNGVINMLIIQFQFSEVDNEDEYNLIPDFCEWICEQMYQKLDTKINRRKIQLRIKYLYNVSWIHWIKKPKFIDTQTIMETIHKSFKYEQYRKGIWTIRTDINVTIPGTNTSADRLIRFIDYGDNVMHATGMFNKLKGDFGFQNLNNLWRLYCLDNLGYLSETKITSNR